MHDLSLYLLDILENSVRAGATVIATRITASRASDTLTIAIEDDGPGLPVAPEQVLDPFFTTKQGKKTGLGLSLFRQATEEAGGHFTLGRSQELGGVAVIASMHLDNIDRAPIGDIATSLRTMAMINPEIEFRVDLSDDTHHTVLRGRDIHQRYAALVAFQEALS